MVLRGCMNNKKVTSKNYRAFALVLLTVVYGFNFIDRQIVGILAPFIQEDLGLSNTQLGLLIGFNQYNSLKDVFLIARECYNEVYTLRSLR